MQTLYAEYFNRTVGFPVVVARTFNLIGPAMPETLAIGAFAAKINNAKNGDSIVTGELSSRRDYIGVDDACDAYWKLLIAGTDERIFNVCSGKSLSMREILAAMIVASKKEIHIQQNDALTTSGKGVPEIYGDYSSLSGATDWIPRQSVIELAQAIVCKHGSVGQ